MLRRFRSSATLPDRVTEDLGAPSCRFMHDRMIQSLVAAILAACAACSPSRRADPPAADPPPTCAQVVAHELAVLAETAGDPAFVTEETRRCEATDAEARRCAARARSFADAMACRAPDGK